MTSELRRLVLDANIMVSALMGQSFPLLLMLFERGVALLAPVHQFAETRKILNDKSSYTADEVDLQMDRLMALVMPIHPLVIDKHEAEARLRLGPRGQPDWPVLAASLESHAAIWSHDKDFFGCGAPVWSTRNLIKQMETVDA